MQQGLVDLRHAEVLVLEEAGRPCCMALRS